MRIVRLIIKKKNMKTTIFRTIARYLCGATVLWGITACDNAGYGVIDNAIYVSEANNNMLQKIMVNENGGKATVSVRTNELTEQEITAKIGIDKALLENYNKKIGTNYVLLPAECYELSNNTVKIAAGAVSASSVDVTIHPLPDEIANSGKKYAIPLSILEVEGGTSVLESVKGVIYALDQVIITSAPKVNRTNTVRYSFLEDPVFDTWTVEMMVNMDNLGNGNNGNFNNQCIFNAGSKAGEKNTTIFVRFGDAMIPGNKLQIKLCGNVVYESNLVFNKNEWYHLAFVYTGSKFRVYIDGELDKETDASYGTFRFDKGNIFSVNGASGYFKCNMKIREVRFWNCPISQTQIKDNMYAVDPQTEGLQGYWKMNEGSGKTLHDATGHGNDGMIEGNTVTWIDNVRSDQKSDAR